MGAHIHAGWCLWVGVWLFWLDHVLTFVLHSMMDWVSMLRVSVRYICKSNPLLCKIPKKDSGVCIAASGPGCLYTACCPWQQFQLCCFLFSDAQRGQQSIKWRVIKSGQCDEFSYRFLTAMIDCEHDGEWRELLYRKRFEIDIQMKLGQGYYGYCFRFF